MTTAAQRGRSMCPMSQAMVARQMVIETMNFMGLIHASIPITSHESTMQSARAIRNRAA